MWLDDILSRLVAEPCCGYRVGGTASVEPTALAAMALAAHGRTEPAATALDWLARIQSADGSLGVTAVNARPRWPTGWALLAWRAATRAERDAPEVSRTAEAGPARGHSRYGSMIERAATWILSFQGCPSPPSPEVRHDTTLLAWPWVEGTHSWVEPTSINLLALKACNYSEHSRARDAVRLLRDRALQTGGWNYGNREIFGTCLCPHIQPTGLALAALAGEESAAREIELAVALLRRSLSPETATASLCYALIGLAAQGEEAPQSDAWLEKAAQRTFEDGAAPYLLALLALAALGRDCPWFTSPSRPSSSRKTFSPSPTVLSGGMHDPAQ